MKIFINKNRLVKLIFFISFFLIIFLINRQAAYSCGPCCAGSCGTGGCRNIYPPGYCYSSEVQKDCGGSTMCCDPGPCLNCTPTCGTGYQSTNNGCSTSGFTCTKTYQCLGGGCGTVGPITCYRLQYLVNIEPQGGSCTTDVNVCGGTASPTISCSRTGYTLINYTQSGCGGSFNSSTGVCSSVTQTTNIYANWSINSYMVWIIAGGGTCSPDDHSVNYGSASSAPNCTRSGYNRTGYTLTGTCGGTFTASTGVCSSVTSEISVTPTWVLANQNPNAPTTPYCNGTTNPTNVTTTNPTFSAIFSDPDASNTGNYYEIEVNTNNTFTSTVMWDTGVLSMTATANGARSPNFTYAGSSLGWSGTTYYWRIRFGDNGGAMSGWSATQNFVMHSNSAPTAPTSLLTEGATNPTEVIDLTPEFSAIFNDANTGDTAVQYEIEVNTNNTFTGTVMWDSNLTGMTALVIGARSPDVSYNGTALSLNGATYYWRIRFVDNYGGSGVWSATAQFTMNNSPYATDLTTETYTNPIKIYDTTPEFSARFNDADTGSTGIYYQINVNTTSAFNGTSMWDSTKMSMTAVPTGSLITDKSYAGTALSLNGTQYFWRIMFWDENNSGGAWSSTSNFRMSGPPDAPTSLLTDNDINPLYLSSVTPTFSAIYTDINDDNSASYEIEVNTNNIFTGTVMWDTGKLATTIASGNRSSNFIYAGTALTGTSNITYYWRIRFWDIDDNVSDWSSVNTFRDTLLHFYLNGLKLNGVRFD